MENDGIHYEADPRQADIIIRDLGLANSNGAVTPCEREDLGKTGSSLTAKDATMYRALVARANFLAQDRSYLGFALKEPSRKMSDPHDVDWECLERLGRYV